MNHESRISFIDLLQLLFIYLKLHGDIGWPWWCVLLPLVSAFVFALIKGGGAK